MASRLGYPAGRCRPGVSLAELLVAVTILGLVIALTSAAVHRARAAAVRAHCQHHLRQLGLAAQAYHGVGGHFPPGVVGENRPSPLPYMGWQAHLLPHLEHSALWEQAVAAYRQEPNFRRQPPHTGLGTPVAVFSCPADPRTSVAHTLGSGTVVALTSYLGVEGHDAFRRDGVLFLDSKVRLADVTDGTSQTLLAGERPPSADLVLGWWYAGWGQDRDGEGDMLLGVRTRNNQSWAPSCPIGPYGFRPGRFSDPCSAFHFWSPHPGGANFALCDGSVRFLRYDADPILPALATRAGGDVTPLPD